MTNQPSPANLRSDAAKPSLSRWGLICPTNAVLNRSSCSEVKTKLRGTEEVYTKASYDMCGFQGARVRFCPSHRIGISLLAFPMAKVYLTTLRFPPFFRDYD